MREVQYSPLSAFPGLLYSVPKYCWIIKALLLCMCLFVSFFLFIFHSPAFSLATCFVTSISVTSIFIVCLYISLYLPSSLWSRSMLWSFSYISATLAISLCLLSLSRFPLSPSLLLCHSPSVSLSLIICLLHFSPPRGSLGNLFGKSLAIP